MPSVISLKDFLPNAGMVYPAERNLLGRETRDAKVLGALKNFIAALGGNDSTRALKRAIDLVIADVFIIGTNPSVLSILTAEDGDVLDLLRTMRGVVQWGRDLPESPFYGLCKTLVDARLAWKANPRPPFNVDHHCAAAKSIDGFLEAVRGHWSEPMFDLYGLLGGWEEGDSEEDEEMVEPAAMSQPNAGPSGDVDVDMMDVDPDEHMVVGPEAITRGVRGIDLNDARWRGL
ncbi:hypothetical protein AAE478_009753 [Parahypoxylon ruwenzoriense]